jgi:hypothetical protein
MRLQENNFVERQSAQAWLERADILFPDRASIDRLEELSTGGTLMTLTDCIKLQEGLCEPASTTIDCTRTGRLFRLEFQPIGQDLWCTFIRTQNMEQAILLFPALHPVVLYAI